LVCLTKERNQDLQSAIPGEEPSVDVFVHDLEELENALRTSRLSNEGLSLLVERSRTELAASADRLANLEQGKYKLMLELGQEMNARTFTEGMCVDLHSRLLISDFNQKNAESTLQILTEKSNGVERKLKESLDVHKQEINKLDEQLAAKNVLSNNMKNEYYTRIKYLKTLFRERSKQTKKEKEQLENTIKKQESERDTIETLKQRIDEMTTTIKERSVASSALSNEKESAEKEIVELRKELTEKDANINLLEGRVQLLEESSDEAANLNELNNHLDRENQSLKKEVECLNSNVTELELKNKEETEKAKNLQTSLNTQIDGHTTRIASLEENILRERDSLMSKYKVEKSKLEETITTLRTKNDQANEKLVEKELIITSQETQSHITNAKMIEIEKSLTQRNTELGLKNQKTEDLENSIRELEISLQKTKDVSVAKDTLMEQHIIEKDELSKKSGELESKNTELRISLNDLQIARENDGITWNALMEKKNGEISQLKTFDADLKEKTKNLERKEQGIFN
jgi:chromosome segregation ATPase